MYINEILAHQKKNRREESLPHRIYLMLDVETSRDNNEMRGAVSKTASS